MKKLFLVELEMPSGVGERDMAAYIGKEVASGVGGLRPEDPLFNLDRSSVRVHGLGRVSLVLRETGGKEFDGETGGKLLGVFSSRTRAEAARREVHSQTGVNIHELKATTVEMNKVSL